jgi:hypothetical protein
MSIFSAHGRAQTIWSQLSEEAQDSIFALFFGHALLLVVFALPVYLWLELGSTPEVRDAFLVTFGIAANGSAIVFAIAVTSFFIEKIKLHRRAKP